LPRLTSAPSWPHEPRLLALAWSLEDDLVLRDPGEDARDQILAYALIGAV